MEIVLTNCVTEVPTPSFSHISSNSGCQRNIIYFGLDKRVVISFTISGNSHNVRVEHQIALSVYWETLWVPAIVSCISKSLRSFVIEPAKSINCCVFRSTCWDFHIEHRSNCFNRAITKCSSE